MKSFAQLRKKLAISALLVYSLLLLSSGLPVESATYPTYSGGRLYGTTGLPNADATATSTVYFGPVGAVNQIDLWNGTGFTTRTFSETAYTLTALVPRNIYDVYAYDNSGTLALDVISATPTQTASNSPVAGSSVTINIASTTGFAVGDMVTVVDGSNSETEQITALVASTSITVGTLAHSYTTPAVYDLNQRSSTAAQSITQGLITLNSDNTKRFVGSFFTLSATTTSDNASTRGIYSYLNHVSKAQSASDSTASWSADNTFSTTAPAGSFQPANASVAVGTSRCEFLLGEPQSVTATYSNLGTSTGVANMTGAAIVLNGTTTTSTNSMTAFQTVKMTVGSATAATASSASVTIPSYIGYGFLQAEELRNTCTYQGSPYESLSMTIN